LPLVVPSQSIVQFVHSLYSVGVIYLPETERMSHYFWARLRDQFDAVLHFDETRAVEPLERTAEWDAGEVRETFPFGI
jgi:erythromycin esterase-like protein